jgi:bifunctional non-homologous end joining protein LigD
MTPRKSTESRRRRRGGRAPSAEARFPDWVDPMLATLVHDPFSDPDWIFERKLDGVRLLAYRHCGEVRLMTRNRKRRDAAYPEIVAALTTMGGPDVVVDGEVVAFEEKVTSFARLQGRMKIEDPDVARDSAIAVYYYVFDIPWIDGRDARGVPLRERKALLRETLVWEDPIRFTAHRNERGEALFRQACARGWEGLIAKRAASPYVHGRSRDWLKLKCVNRQEFVVGGWTDPAGKRVGFGALLLGYRDGEALRYAGKVGTGFDEETLADLGSRLAAIERKTPPFAAERGLPSKGVHWTRPSLVAEVGFTEWTKGGKLRHPRFVGLRTDKDPADVVREIPT